MSHALLSPSGGDRWLLCTPSARLEQDFPDTAGEAAAEGTLAHKIGELMIQRGLKWITQFNYDQELQFLQQTEYESKKLYQPEMLGYCSEYADFVISKYYEALAIDPNARIYLEYRLDMSAFIPEGFGTADVVIVCNGRLYFIDLKYGKGVPVHAENNSQVQIYALGALDEFDMMYGFETVSMSIFQPRIDNTSTWVIPAQELYDWAQLVVIPTAKIAFAGEGEYNPGEKQCMFCKAKGMCKALADYNLELAKHEFANADLLTDEDVSDILNRAGLFEKWLKAVKSHALYEAVQNDKVWPGYKVVEGRANRKYTDTAEIAATLIKQGYKASQISKPRQLFGITELEGVVGKKALISLVGAYIIKPAGKPVLVPLSDKRNGFGSKDAALAAFAEVGADDFDD